MSTIDLADLASEQQGMVTSAQAHGLGVSTQQLARLANRGVLERVTHGVYRVAGAPPSPDDGLRAAWLTFNPAARTAERLFDPESPVVSHRSAARLHGLGDLDADDYEFTAPNRKQSRRPEVRIHRGQVPAEDRTVVDGLPVTTIVRTVSDLAAARIDGGHLAGVVRDALTIKHVDDRELIGALRPHAHAYGAPLGDGEALLVTLLQEAGIPDSLERAAELAYPERFVAGLDNAQIRRIHEQLASITARLDRAIGPETLRNLRQISESANRVIESPALEQLRNTVRIADTAAETLASDPQLQARLRRIVEDANKTLAAAGALRRLGPVLEETKAARSAGNDPRVRANRPDEADGSTTASGASADRSSRPT